MAVIQVIIEDVGDDNVQISIVSDPEFSNDISVTGAQSMAIQFVEALGRDCQN